MIITMGSDHGGLELKNKIKEYLLSINNEVIDYGTCSNESCDYPDYGFLAAEDVANGKADYGIVICSTGIGMSIVANKVKGIRCALVNNVAFAKLTKEHNDTNMLALGAMEVDFELAKEIVNAWLNTPFSNHLRHIRRVNKIIAYEDKKNE